MLAKIKELVVQDYFVNKRGTSFTLTENAIEATRKEATFEAEHEDYIIFKFDETSRLFPFYTDVNKAQRMCDYIIFYKKEYVNEIELFAVICNLKSGKKGNSPDQIYAGQLFAKFIFDTAKRLSPDEFDAINLNVVKVLFHNIKSIGFTINYRDKGLKINKGGLIYLKSNQPFIFEHWCRKNKAWIS